MRTLLLLFLATPAFAADEVFVSTSSRNPVQKALGLGVQAATGLTEGAFKLTRRVTRVALELGAGDDIEVREVTDPFMPKGLERLFAWDMRLVVRNEGLAFRLNHLDPPGFRRISMQYRMRFDPFARAGIAQERDDVYESAGFDAPVEKRGYGLGMSAVHNAWWGYRASYDRVRFSEDGKTTRDQNTVLGAGYSPLGDNPGRPWNWSMVGGATWQELDENEAGVRSLRHGPGFFIGPAYQLGLDKVKAPWKIRPNRATVRLEYSDSQIQPSSFLLAADVSAYLTKSLRLTLGASQSWLPGHGTGAFSIKFAASLLINFRDFRFEKP